MRFVQSMYLYFGARSLWLSILRKRSSCGKVVLFLKIKWGAYYWIPEITNQDSTGGQAFSVTLPPVHYPANTACTEQMCKGYVHRYWKRQVGIIIRMKNSRKTSSGGGETVGDMASTSCIASCRLFLDSTWWCIISYYTLLSQSSPKCNPTEGGYAINRHNHISPLLGSTPLPY